MKLAIISHTEHYKKTDGTIVGWGSTVNEINHLAGDFDEIFHIAFLHPGSPPQSSLPYTAPNITFVPLKPVGGTNIFNKIKIVLNIPTIISTVQKTLKKVDVFQFRAPTGIGVFLIPYLTLFSRKKGWYKYAGDWSQTKPPTSSAIQRWLLKKQKRKVTINGSWPNQPKHCLSFENPCITEEDRKSGLQAVEKKAYLPKFSFCFVGRLDDDKGVHHIIDAFGKFNEMQHVGTIHFIGNGPHLEHYTEECNRLGLPAIFHGFLEREKVFEIYKECTFMLLPSKSEGFPKVIAEAMNFGCIPLASDISCIGQYINSENGYTINPLTSDRLKELLVKAINENQESLKRKGVNCQMDTASFTFTNYRERIQKEILTEM